MRKNFLQNVFSRPPTALPAGIGSEAGRRVQKGRISSAVHPDFVRSPSEFRPQTKKISSAVEKNFVCGRNFFHLRMIFITKECEKDEKHENSMMGKDIEDEPPVAPMELLPR
ncbi:MAG: hypothetical protein IKG96_10930 [Bacteroidaceae bacterium]|nr:hypothetical protein [Bacteroidaceae bacterium]